MPYGSAKAGLQQMTRMLAAEWAEHGIRVNCVAAGLTKTEGFIRGRKLAGLDPDANVGSNAMRRPGRPEEIAYPVLFLASDAASFMTGETIAVSGGARAG